MHKVIVVGGGPAGLMAAQVLSCAGVSVHLFDAMPSVGRKFLLAGKGGLNLTHAEALETFVTRFGPRQEQIRPLLRTLSPTDVRDWAQALGIKTFVGSSNRVFPADMKAAPLLRAWLHLLRHPAPGGVPVQFHSRQRWSGWPATDSPPCVLLFMGQDQREQIASADAVVLALGGGSWPHLGSDATWVPWLIDRGVAVSQLLPANCGFDRANGWSESFAGRFAGLPFKSVAIRVVGHQGEVFERKGEFVATDKGIEGSLVYAASRLLRDNIMACGQATLLLDLLPERSAAHVLSEVSHPRGSRSLSSHLKSRLRLDGIKTAILHELLDKVQLQDPQQLARLIKALPLVVHAPRPLSEAISSAGGVSFEAMDDQLMLNALPGVFCAGEMLDWEAPTGGYLLSACLASGAHAGQGVLRHLKQPSSQ